MRSNNEIIAIRVYYQKKKEKRRGKKARAYQNRLFPLYFVNMTV
jgi:hypothetical protein